MSCATVIALARSSGFQLTIDADRLEYEAPSPASPTVLEALRQHKAEVIDLLRAERRTIVRRVNDHFQTSPLGQCAYCGGDRNERFVAVFVGVDRADIHTACYAPWLAERETHARAALEIEQKNDVQRAPATGPSPMEQQFAFKRQMNGA